MSRHELQNLISLHSTFTFIDGRTDEGIIVSRYNIPQACVEYYVIPASNVTAYQSARSHHDLEAHKKLGYKVDVSSILYAQTIS